MAETLSQNTVLWIILSGVIVTGGIAIALVLLFHLSRRKVMQKELELKEERLAHQQELLHHNLMILEQERKRIASELHDEIGNKLNVVRLQLSQLGMEHPDEPTFIDTKKLVDASIETTRRISYGLRPPSLESFGLSGAINELADQAASTGKFEMVYKNDGLEKRVDKEQEMQVYRIVQELLTNAIKYSEANRVLLDVILEKGHMGIEYFDDGRGFDLESVQLKSGIGWRNINERVKILNGHIIVHTAPQEGVHIKINCNLKHHE